MANFKLRQTGEQIQKDLDKIENDALVKPSVAPSATSILAIDSTNAQTMLTVGDGLNVENGALKATTDVQQTTGQSTTAVMSQKATTVEINALSDRIVWATPKQYGAVGDGVHDDTEAINACLAENHNVFFPDGTYMVTATNAGFAHSTEGGLFPQSDSVITLSNNAKIKCITGTTDFYNIIHIYNVSNVIIQGGKVEGDKETHTPISTETYEFGCGVIVQNSNNIVVRDMEIYNCIGDGITTDYSGNNNVRFENIKIHDCRRQGISIISGNDIVVSNCEIYNINGTMPKCGIDIEPDGTRTVENVLIENCYIHDNAEASLLIANTTNTINGIRVVGCTLDYLHLNGGTNVAVGTSGIKKVTVGCQDVAVLSNCTIKKMMLNCGNAVFSNCRFACDNESYFIQVLSDRVATQYSKLIQFNGCSFDVRGCDYFIFLPSAKYTGVDLMEFNNCNAEISHNVNVASGYALSGFSNRMPNKTVIVGSKFIFSSKVYQLFTSGGNANVEIDIIDSTIQNTNAHRTEYFIGGYSAYDVWIENSALENYLNMLGDTSDGNATGSILLLNDDLTQFTNPIYKISDAVNTSIVNVTKSNTMNISGLTSNVQSQLNGKQDVISDLATIRSNASAGAEKVSCTDETVGSFGYLKLADLPIYDGSVV